MMHKKIKISVQTERTAHKNVQTFTVLYHREFLKDARDLFINVMLGENYLKLRLYAHQESKADQYHG